MTSYSRCCYSFYLAWELQRDQHTGLQGGSYKTEQQRPSSPGQEFLHSCELRLYLMKNTEEVTVICFFSALQ